MPQKYLQSEPRQIVELRFEVSLPASIPVRVTRVQHHECHPRRATDGEVRLSTSRNQADTRHRTPSRFRTLRFHGLVNVPGVGYYRNIKPAGVTR